MKSEDVKNSISDWSSLVLQGKNVKGTVARKKMRDQKCGLLFIKNRRIFNMPM